MNFHILTLFPEMVEQGLNTSIIGRACEKGTLSISAVNIRDYTLDKHKKVDDYPYGGGAGMLMQAQPVYDAYVHVMDNLKTKQRPRVVYVTPQGKVFNQSMAKEMAQEQDLIFLCGHYEGIDERVLEEIVTDYVSIGDYVVTAGGSVFPQGLMVGKVMYLLTGGKINPLIGSAGVSAVPMAARVSQTVGQKENPTNSLLMHAMGPNVAGVIGSAVAAGFFLTMIK